MFTSMTRQRKTQELLEKSYELKRGDRVYVKGTDEPAMCVLGLYDGGVTAGYFNMSQEFETIGLPIECISKRQDSYSADNLTAPSLLRSVADYLGVVDPNYTDIMNALEKLGPRQPWPLKGEDSWIDEKIEAAKLCK